MKYVFYEKEGRTQTQDFQNLQNFILYNAGKVNNRLWDSRTWKFLDEEKRKSYKENDGDLFLIDFIGNELWVCKKTKYKYNCSWRLHKQNMPVQFSSSYYRDFVPIYCISLNMKEDIGACFNGVVVVQDWMFDLK